MAALPESLRQDAEAFSIEDKEHTVKMLGIKWHCVEDCFIFAVNHADKNLPDKITKRKMLSDISRIFDPLGNSCTSHDCLEASNATNLDKECKLG